MLLCMVACQKDNEDILTLEIENYNSDAKMHLDNAHFAVWDNGDSIMMNGIDYEVTVGSTSATITGNFTEETAYYAIYPARMATSTTSLTMPAVQRYRENENNKQVIDAPMYGYYDGTGTLKFHNLGSILAVNVTNNNTTSMTVQRIEVIAENGVALSGPATITNTTSDAPTMTINSGYGINSVALKGINVTLAANESKIFYVALPVISNAKLTINVFDDTYCYSRTQSSANASFARNTAHQVAFATNVAAQMPYKPTSTQVFYFTNNGGAYYVYGMLAVVGFTFGSADCISNTYDTELGYGTLTFNSSLTDLSEFCNAIIADASNITRAILPESVAGTLGSYTYSSCKNLEWINIPSGITKLDSYALNDLESLQRIDCYCTTPPTLNSDCFLECNSEAILHVPSGTKAAYAATDCNHFTPIIDDL